MNYSGLLVVLPHSAQAWRQYQPVARNRLPTVAIICLFDPIRADFRPLGTGTPKHADKAVNIGYYWCFRVPFHVRRSWLLPSSRAGPAGKPSFRPGSRGRSLHPPGLVGDDVRSPAHASSRRRLQPSASSGSPIRSPHRRGGGERGSRLPLFSMSALFQLLALSDPLRSASGQAS